MDYLLSTKQKEVKTEQEWRYLNNAVNKYHIETEKQYGREYADKAVYDPLVQ